MEGIAQYDDLTNNGKWQYLRWLTALEGKVTRCAFPGLHICHWFRNLGWCSLQDRDEQQCWGSWWAHGHGPACLDRGRDSGFADHESSDWEHRAPGGAKQVEMQSMETGSDQDSWAPRAQWQWQACMWALVHAPGGRLAFTGFLVRRSMEHQSVRSGGQAGEVGSCLITKGLRPVVKEAGPHPWATSNIRLEEWQNQIYVCKLSHA